MPSGTSGKDDSRGVHSMAAAAARHADAALTQVALQVVSLQVAFTIVSEYDDDLFVHTAHSQLKLSGILK